MLRKALMSIALVFIIAFSAFMYMNITIPYYMETAEAAKLTPTVESPYLTYGHPARHVLLINGVRPAIPYKKLVNNPYRYSKWTVALQKNLNAYHGFNLRADGFYGHNTMVAVNRLKIRYNLPSKNGNIVDWTTWYIVTTQKSNSGYRFRLSWPPSNFKSHALTYKIISRPTPKPIAKPVYHEGVFPVAGRHTMFSNWHAPRFPNRLHMGIDIAAKTHTPLVAIYSGQVYHVWSSLGGVSLWIVRPNGNVWYYAHMQGYATRNGAYVKSGQLVGWVDSTGNARSTGPHLHLGLKYNGMGGSWSNPYYILRSLE